MRITDGSPAANPVMGVIFSFETTLTRDSGGGLPVLLGSSQAQVMTDQNGVASIVPSVGSVGPCDVFITVSAGQLTAQFQMESVGAISSEPRNNPVKDPIARRDPFRMPPGQMQPVERRAPLPVHNEPAKRAISQSQFRSRSQSRSNDPPSR